MFVFFDTEFEGLFDDAELVSIGCVTEDLRKTYYAENLSFDISRCSDFCKAVVLPLLERGQKQMPIYMLKQQLYTWLTSLGPDVVLVCDSPRDIVQLDRLFAEGLPPNCSYKLLGFWAKMWRRTYNINRRLYRKYHLRDHHALDDAVVNCLIFTRQAPY